MEPRPGLIVGPEQLLQAKGISPKEVADAINAYNLASPTGVARIDTHEYPVTLNNTPTTPAQFNDIPIKVVGGATIFMRDVAQVRDGSQAQPIREEPAERADRAHRQSRPGIGTVWISTRPPRTRTG